ncbi:MAG: prepilin peptidase [Candidatus Zambryskibacteria bacterium]|nr:prepilin peptidase [Candidatus Zambryskibacteria bacterium]
MTGVILFVLGAVVGSFLNVVGLRWDSSILGRSKCPYCHKTLEWWELIPIVSFFLLRVKCSKCRAGISWQYPLIEIWTGLIFLSIFNLEFSIFNKLITTIIFCIYIVITIYDLRHKIIPDSLVYSAILLSVISRWLSVSSTLDWLAGPIIFTFFAFIWLLTRGRAIGFGDAKLGLSVGLLLGAAEGFSAIILAFWIGAVTSLFYIFLNKSGFLKDSKKLTIKSEIPFAPFIIIGAWVSLIFNLNLLHVALS